MARLTTCPDCGAKVSKKAAACPGCGRKLGRSFLGSLVGTLIKLTLLLIVGLIGLMVLAAKNHRPGPAGEPAPAQATPVASSLNVGDEATLQLPGATAVFLALDDESWDKMIDAENAKDLEEIALLMAKGKVIREVVGTRVKVIQNAVLSRKVRIREGDNPGVEAWIQAEFVKPAS